MVLSDDGSHSNSKVTALDRLDLKTLAGHNFRPDISPPIPVRKSAPVKPSAPSAAPTLRVDFSLIGTVVEPADQGHAVLKSSQGIVWVIGVGESFPAPYERLIIKSVSIDDAVVSDGHQEVCLSFPGSRR